MANYQATRGTPRIFELARAVWLDLPFQLTEDPETLEHKLAVIQSLGGQVQTQPGVPSNRLRVVFPAMDAEARYKWKRMFDRTLASGSRVEFVRDSGRYFWLAGDSERDIEAGQKPSGTQYSMVTPGLPNSGANDVDYGGISVDLANPGTATRTNLVANGDFLDGTTGATPTGWVVDTPSTLSAVKSTYVRPNGELGACIEFHYLAAGTKTAHINVQLGGYNATNLPSEFLNMSMLWRGLAAPGSTLTVFSAAIVLSDASSFAFSFDNQPPPVWTRAVSPANLTAATAADTTVTLKLSFDNDLKLCPVAITELQLQAGPSRSTFIPYSTVRTELTGSRAAADLLFYLNALAYRHQLPAWVDDVPFEFTVAFTFDPHWSAANIPTATVWLYGDGDVADVDTIQALAITTTLNTVTATLTLSDGTTEVVSFNRGSWVVDIGSRIVVSVRDGDGTAASGNIDLYTDGVLRDSDTFALRSARQGQFFWIGSKPDRTATAGGTFKDVAVQPVYIDGTAVLLAEFEEGIRPDRNSCRAVLDPGQKGRSDRSIDNQVPLDVQFIEVVT